MKEQLLELLALSVELTKSDSDWPAKSRVAVASEIKRLVKELDASLEKDTPPETS